MIYDQYNQETATGLVELPSGLLVSEYVAEDYARSRNLRPIAIDLFAGAGGMSLGLIQAGFEVVAAVDNSVECAITYMVNLGAYPCKFHFLGPGDEQRLEKSLNRYMKGDKLEAFPTAGSGWRACEPEGTPGVSHFFLGDASKMTGKYILDTLGLEREQVDVVCGGPPCQGFSTAGKRNVMDPRNSLVFEFARLVCEIRPKSVVFENVPGIMTMVTEDGLPVLDSLCRILEDGGMGTYKSLVKCLKAQAGSVGFLREKPADRKRKTKKKPKKNKKEKLLFE